MPVAVLLSFWAFPASGEADNIMLNPEFETGNLTNWTAEQSAIHACRWSMQHSGD